MGNRYLHVKLIDRFEVRPFAPSDGVQVVDLLWKCYGYSYRGGAGDAVYDPDAFADAVRRGALCGNLAVTASGQAVGAVCTREQRPGEIETFGLAVDPSFRGRGLGIALSETVRQEAVAAGARKVAMTAVTRHPLAQKTFHAFSVLPCYLQVGVHPPSLGFRGQDREAPTYRETLLYGALLLERRKLEVWLPPAVAPLARLVTRTHGLERVERDPTPAAVDEALEALPERGRVDIDLRSSWLAAWIAVESPGKDTIEVLKGAIEDLRAGFCEYVEVRLPLSSAWATAALAELTPLGLVATGVEPDVNGRDELCLVAVTPGRAQLDRAVLVHATAKALAARALATSPALAARASASARAPRAADPAPRARPALPPAPRAEVTTAPGGIRLPAAPAEVLHARLQAVRQLAAGLAHEVNNPLNIIQGASYAMRARLGKVAELPPAERDATFARLDTITGEVQRVATLLRQLQRFSELALTPEQSSTIDLAAAVEEAIAIARGAASARGIGVEVRLERDLPLLRGASTEIGELVIQLLVNACEASAPEGKVHLSLERRGEHAVIACRDEGRGIPENELPHVLEPFFTTKQAGEGVGLGLSIAAGVAERHGGYLRIESAVGAGTTVEAWLPLARTDAPVLPTPTERDPPAADAPRTSARPPGKSSSGEHGPRPEPART